jgi:HSP20 family protein
VDVAVKKRGLTASLMGDELRQFIRAVSLEERSSMVLGETGGPLLDLYETPDDVVIEADLPGIGPEDMEISILHGVVTIEGVKREHIDEQDKINYLCMERSFESFRRTLRLSVPINPHNAKAQYARGVLTVTIPKIKEKRGLVVKVRVDKD